MAVGVAKAEAVGVADLKVGIGEDVSCTTRRKEVQGRCFVPSEEGATMPCNFAIVSFHSMATTYLRS